MKTIFYKINILIILLMLLTTSFASSNICDKYLIGEQTTSGSNEYHTFNYCHVNNFTSDTDLFLGSGYAYIKYSSRGPFDAYMCVYDENYLLIEQSDIESIVTNTFKWYKFDFDNTNIIESNKMYRMVLFGDGLSDRENVYQSYVIDTTGSVVFHNGINTIYNAVAPHDLQVYSNFTFGNYVFSMYLQLNEMPNWVISDETPLNNSVNVIIPGPDGVVTSAYVDYCEINNIVIKQEYTAAVDSGSLFTLNIYKGQSFSNPTAFYPTTVWFKLYKSVLSVADFDVNIYIVDNETKDLDDAVAYGTINSLGITTNTAGGIKVCTLDYGGEVQDGKTYAIILTAPDADYWVAVKTDESAPTYTNGCLISYDGSVWIGQPNKDCYFRVFGRSKTGSYIVFSSNASGSWVDYANFNFYQPTTFSMNYSWFNESFKKYYWNVSAYNEFDVLQNKSVFAFTTFDFNVISKAQSSKVSFLMIGFSAIFGFMFLAFRKKRKKDINNT